MKKIFILCSVCTLFLLSGCKDATTNISDKNEMLFKVGDTTVTKGDLYQQYIGNANTASLLMQLTKEKLFDVIVPATEEMKKEAQEKLAEEKKQAGDTFLNSIKAYGFQDEEDYLNNGLLLNIRQDAMVNKYVTDEYENDVKTVYQPIQVQILTTTNLENAKTALERIKKGEDFETVTKEFGNMQTYTGAKQVIHKQIGLPASVFKKIQETNDDTLIDQVLDDLDPSDANPDTDNQNMTPNYYVIKVNSKDVQSFKEEAIKTLTSLAAIKDGALTFYLSQYNFTVYDIDLYNHIKSTSPTYLVQDTK